jgi:hypothetical protein
MWLTMSRSIFEPSGCFVEHPVLQCVQIKTMEPKAGDANPVQRFRVVLSDVRNFIQTMIATSGCILSNVEIKLIVPSCERDRHIRQAEKGFDSQAAQVQPAASQRQEVRRRVTLFTTQLMCMQHPDHHGA